MKTRIKKIHIAEMLRAQQLITDEQLEKAIQEQKKTDKKIGQILVDFGYIAEDKLYQLLAEQLQITYVDLKNYTLDPDIVKLLPEFYARHFRSIILKKMPDHYLIGRVDPQDLLGQDEISNILKKPIQVALIREDDLLYVLDNIYRRVEDITRFAETLSAELKPTELNLLTQKHDFSSEDMPVVNLLRSIFEDANQINASDIHIEPGENSLTIRLRVDGVLQEQVVPTKSITEALIQRIKMMSGLNIAEKRLPQDGRFTIRVKNTDYDVRVSTLPVQYGESLVMRLLNQSAHILNIEQVGMPAEALDYFKQLLTASYGILLIVGPTGSGKTTTLYAALNELNKAEDKIITVEDPIEYRLPRINQVQVNPKIGLTFASVLRSILRQDPDIIMIGELRDYETVEIALRAAMTGHFVLGTLHTNDTISTATRLLDMGAAGYLIASVLRAILAQRLVRHICKKCICDDPLTDAEKIWLMSMGFQQTDPPITFKRGKGCTYCHHTGYSGRIGVFELLPITNPLADALRKNDITLFNQIAEKEPLYRPLVKTGLDLACRGLTSVQEVINMAGMI